MHGQKKDVRQLKATLLVNGAIKTKMTLTIHVKKG
jgi:hypothetical protein